MSWLTRIRVEVREGLSAGLKDGYSWHQALWHCFPGKDGQRRDFLSRVDERDGTFEALMLSPDKPGTLSWGNWETKEVKPSFLEHRRYRFALRANPTVKRVVRSASGERIKNGRRTRICGPDELLDWLRRKGEAAGFVLEQAQAGPPVDQHSHKPGRNGSRGQRITHARVDFDGVLAVEDFGAFVKAYATGIGPAKAFGFGLLLLKPLAD